MRAPLVIAYVPSSFSAGEASMRVRFGATSPVRVRNWAALHTLVLGCPGPEEVDQGHTRGGTGLFVDRGNVTIERGARKEKRCGNVLNALIRNDQGSRISRSRSVSSKGGDEGVEALIRRELRCLHERGVGTCGRKISTKIVGSKRQPVLHHVIIGSLPQLSQQRNRNTHKHHECRADCSQHVLTRDNRHRRRRHEHRAHVIDDATHARPKI